MTAAQLEYPWTAPPAAGETCAVAKGVHWLRMPLPFALDHINLWLLEQSDGYTLVDTGYGDAATRAIWERHFAATLHGAPLRQLLVTHYHPDHLGNGAWLANHFGCPVFMTQAEFLNAHAIAEQYPPYSVVDVGNFFARHGMAPEHLRALEGRGNRYRAGVPTLPFAFRRLIADDRVRAGGHAWTVISGFGHSPEHAALYAPAAGVLISGDMLLPRISTNIAVWPAEPEGDPLARFLHSLAAFEALPPDTLVLPSHGLPFRGIALRVAQLRAHHVARLEELQQAIVESQAPASAAALVPTLFRRELDLQQRFFAMGEAIAHLNHLWHAGRVSRQVEDDGTIRFAA